MAKIWSWEDVKATADDTLPSIIMLRSGSGAFLLAGTQIMGEQWRWDEYGNPIEMDEMEALLSQANEDIMSELDFCAYVANCISTSGETQAALAETASDAGGSAKTGGNWLQQIAQSILEEDMLPDDYGCLDDYIFGMAKTIVESIHLAVVEVFQKIETTTNPLELAVELTDNVPIGEAAGIPGEIAAWVQDTMYEEYLAAWSLAIWDVIACQLFCAMKETSPCSLSLETITGVYTSLVGGVPSQEWTFLEWFEWILGLGLTTNEAIVKVAGIFGLAVLRFGSLFGFFGLGVRSLETVILLARDDQDSDWSVVCPACPAPTWTATASLKGAVLPAYTTIPSGYGTFVPTSGIEVLCVDAGGLKKMAYVRVDTGTEYEMVGGYHVKYESLVLGQTDTSQIQATMEGLFGSPPVYENIKMWKFGEVFPGNGVLNTLVDRHVGMVQLYLRSSIYSCGGDGFLTEVQIRGQGANPFDGQAGWVIT